MRFSELIDLINTYQSLERRKEELDDGCDYDFLCKSAKEEYKIIIQKLEEMREMEIL